MPARAPGKRTRTVDMPAATPNTPAGILDFRAGVLHKPAGVLNRPAGVLHRPAKVLHKPAGAFDKPATAKCIPNHRAFLAHGRPINGPKIFSRKKDPKIRTKECGFLRPFYEFLRLRKI